MLESTMLLIAIAAFFLEEAELFLHVMLSTFVDALFFVMTRCLEMALLREDISASSSSSCGDLAASSSLVTHADI